MNELDDTQVVWNEGNISKERVMFYAQKYPRQLFWLLTKDDFMVAKALWGETKYYLDDHRREPIKKGWKYHLQKMVIADDPIEYLKATMEA